MFDFIASLLSTLYDFAGGNYFLAISLLTLLVLLVSTPLTLSGTRSMLKMQLLQPDIKAIQNKYGPDQREQMNKELMEYYQENNINPVGGCIPLLFQIPVFLVFYRVIIGLTRRATDVGFTFGQVTGETASDQNATAYEAGDDAFFNPAYLSEDSNMFEDLSTSNVMPAFGDFFDFDLAHSASGVLADSFIDSLPYLVLVAVVGLSGWVQHRMIRARQTGAVVNPTQEMIMKMMPIFLPVFSFTLPAAIVIYFLISNLYRIGQQYYITRSMYHGDESLGAQVRKMREDESAKGGSKSGGGNKGGGGNRSGGGAKGSGAKKSSSAKGSSGRGGTATKKKASSRTAAPGRNSSGRTGSARAQVQARPRKHNNKKKKKR